MHICSKCSLARSLRYSGSRGGCSDPESDWSLLHQCQNTANSKLQWVHTHTNTHSHTHWQAACSLTNNDFFSAVTLTMCISCLFSLYLSPTFPLNVIWCFPCVLLSIVSVPHSFPNDLLFPLIPNIRSNPTFLLHCGPAWQGTDLMHNHVLADNSPTVAGFPGNPPCSDQSEDSDYDSLWTAASCRTASFSRKIFRS